MYVACENGSYVYSCDYVEEELIIICWLFSLDLIDSGPAAADIETGSYKSEPGGVSKTESITDYVSCSTVRI